MSVVVAKRVSVGVVPMSVVRLMVLRSVSTPTSVVVPTTGVKTGTRDV
jgi:hypothetical protein